MQFFFSTPTASYYIGSAEIEIPSLDGALGEEVVKGPQCCLYFRSPKLGETRADGKTTLLEGMFKRKAKIRGPPRPGTWHNVTRAVKSSYCSLAIS